MGRKSIKRIRKPLTKKAQAWLRELVTLLQNKELDKLTLDEMAELIGKSKSTIYSYFSTKEEIYQAAIQLILDDMLDLLSTEATSGENMEDVLQVMLIKISEGIEGISISFLEQLQVHFPEVWMLIEQFTDQLLQTIEMIYRQGMDQGDFKSYNLQLILALDKH
ncbi:MAG: TetR/AcrR family transcriptional regulator, partial [Ekhidna sp.]|nr:TetR/AcrR family transcriptional regulator [Ekhidna sp.]